MGYGEVGDQSPPTQRVLWEELQPEYSWDDLVLPRRQRELLRDLPAEFRDPLASRVGYGHREARPQKLTLLFTGPSGAGKTMAAQILGAALDVPIVQLDLLDALSQARENVDEWLPDLLGSIEGARAVVIFDAPGSILEDHGAELIELLQRSYRYPGVAILALTSPDTIDPALAARFDFVIEFPAPDRDAREQIWRNVLPRDSRVTEAQLRAAASAELSAAMIWSCCEAAAEYAADNGSPIQDRHVIRALESVAQLEPARPVSAPVAPSVEPEPPQDVETEPRERVEEPPAERKPPAREPATRKPAAREPVVPEAKPAPPPEPEPAPPPEPEPEPAPPPQPKSALPPQPKSAPPPPPKREPEPQPTPAPRRVRKPRTGVRPSLRSSPRPAMLAIAGTLAAAVLGFVIAHSVGGSASTNRRAAAGSLQLEYPASWRREGSTSPGLSDAIALRRTEGGGGTLVVGRSTSTGSILPANFVSGLRTTPATQVVTIGRLAFYRYANLPAAGTGSLVYALPSTAGTIVGVCAGGAAPSRCEAVLGTVRLSSGSVLPPQQNLSYAQGLDSVVGRLNAIREAAGYQLQHARDARSQAAAADQLAAAHAAAASALLHLSAGSASSANAALASALRETGTAYGSLAQAASHNNATAYRDATNALKKAGASSASAFAQLGKLGYVVG